MHQVLHHWPFLIMDEPSQSWLLMLHLRVRYVVRMLNIWLHMQDGDVASLVHAGSRRAFIDGVALASRSHGLPS
jgi:hypothetical protein